MIRATVLMATRDGARHLAEQLASLVAQEGVEVRLAASDDGSVDGTRGLLDAFVREHGGSVAEGPRQGAAANFLSLIAGTETEGIVALCDQDDVWLPEKLRSAAAMLASHAGPALWVGRVSVCDATLTHCVPAPMPRRAPSFGEALAEAVGSGNAMVWNAAAARLLREAVRAGEAEGVPHHDWWVTQMVAGAGGAVILDDLPTTLYRQHGGNALGSGHGLCEVLRGPLRLLDGRYARDARAQRAALVRSEARLTAEARATLTAVEGLRERSAWARPGALRAAGVRRQSALAQAGLLLAATLGKL